MGSRAGAKLVYGIPLQMDLDESAFEDGLLEFVYNARDSDPDYPVDVVWTSTREYPKYIVILPGTDNHTDWDAPVMINELPDLPQDKIAAMHAWIVKHGLDSYVEGEEGWWLAARWD